MLSGLTPKRILNYIVCQRQWAEKDQFPILENARRDIGIADIERISTRLIKGNKLDENDITATECHIDHLEKKGAILWRQKQVVQRSTTNKSKFEVVKHFEVGIMTDFGAEMLRRRGNEMVFLDATSGLNKYGYPMITLLVVDEFREVVPVAFAIVGSENKITVAKFLELVRNKVGGDFQFNTVMMDQGKAQIAACKQLNIKYLLCCFHLYQDLQRNMMQAEYGVSDVLQWKERQWIFQEIHSLQAIQDEAVFHKSFPLFIESLRDKGLEKLAEYLQEWGKEEFASHWVAFGRLDVRHINDTNNPIEAFFRVLKYSFAGRKVQRRLEFQLQLLTKVHLQYVNDRQQKVTGFHKTKAQKVDEFLSFKVKRIRDKGITPVDNSYGLCCTHSYKLEALKQYSSCVGDGSCECSENEKSICPHLEATSTECPLTHAMLEATARKICTKKVTDPRFLQGMIGGAVECMFYCPTLSKPDSGRYYTANAHESTCDCNIFNQHGLCPHVLAAHFEHGFPLSDNFNMKIEELKQNPLKLQCPRRVFDYDAMPPAFEAKDFTNQLSLESEAIIIPRGELQEIKAQLSRLGQKLKGMVPAVLKIAGDKLARLEKEVDGIAAQYSFRPPAVCNDPQKKRVGKRTAADNITKPVRAYTLSKRRKVEERSPNEEQAAEGLGSLAGNTKAGKQLFIKGNGLQVQANKLKVHPSTKRKSTSSVAKKAMVRKLKKTEAAKTAKTAKMAKNDKAKAKTMGSKKKQKAKLVPSPQWNLRKRSRGRMSRFINYYYSH